MATVERFEDLKCWQESRVLCQMIFEHFIESYKVKDFELVNQINAASGSVMDNIAEGFERDGNKEFGQFLSIAKASCGEVRSQLYRGLDRGYVSKSTFDSIYAKTLEIGKMIAGLMTYLRESEMKGRKFSVDKKTRT